jgi:flagellar hook assembly protein FlgD
VVYDATGREVRTLVDARQTAGVHRAHWDGRDNAGRMMTPGVYFFDLITSDGKITGKALLLQ